MADTVEMHQMQSQQDNEDNPIQRKLSDILRYDDMYWFQKIIYYLLYPLLWLMDLRYIRKREWIQLPILTYTIEITQIIIALILVKLYIDGIKNSSVVAIYLSVYTLCIGIACLLLLYCFTKYTTQFHYNYFVNISIYIIAYGLLYLFVYIQYVFFSDTVALSWLWFFILYAFAVIVIAIIIFSKQFIFKTSMNDNILDEYRTYKHLYHVPQENEAERVSLIQHPSNALIDFESHQMEEVEMHRFSDTIFRILNQIWSIALGFILVECIIDSLIGSYVNLLMYWREETVAVDNATWYMVVIGTVLALITVSIESIIEIYCKAPCYLYVHNNNDNNCIVFVLSFLNELSVMWSEILAAAIGWALLTPNQSKGALAQFERACIGTLVFILFGVTGQKFKLKKQNKILIEMDRIKNDEFELFKEKKLKSKTRKLILYERLIKIYNTALAVAVSFAWESFEDKVIESDYEEVKAVALRIIYAALSLIIYIQFGLQLSDLRKERLNNAMHMKTSV